MGQSQSTNKSSSNQNATSQLGNHKSVSSPPGEPSPLLNLPSDLWNHVILPELAGPTCYVLHKEPSQDQKNQVTECGVSDDPKKTKTPRINAYHLIVKYSDNATVRSVKIGFCKKPPWISTIFDGNNYTYQEHVVDSKSPLYRYVTERPMTFQDEGSFTEAKAPLLMKYLTQEIKAQGGLAKDPLQDVINFSKVSRQTYQLIKKHKGMSYSTNQRVLKRLDLHVSYGEQTKAEKILKSHPELLLSEFKTSATDCSLGRTFTDATAFQRAVFYGDWHMWNMMLKIVDQLPEKQQKEYYDDLLKQFNEVQDKGLEYTLDNPLNKGLRILDADDLEDENERKRLEKDIVDRDAYHLIVKTKGNNGARVVESCTLGYRDPKTKKYTQHELNSTDPLFLDANELYKHLKSANDGHGNEHQHFVTRSQKNLVNLKVLLKKLGVETDRTEQKSKVDLTELRNALEIYIDNYPRWTAGQCREHWHVVISAAIRLFPPNTSHCWMSNDLPWTIDENEMNQFVDCKIRPSRGLNFLDEPLFPLSSFLGDRFAAGLGSGWGRAARGLGRRCCLLKSLLKIETQKRWDLSNVLKAKQPLRTNQLVV